MTPGPEKWPALSDALAWVLLLAPVVGALILLFWHL